jgi:steroid 5-alpha reductase family enzyme
MQGVLLFMVSSPAQVGILAAGSTASLSVLGWLGLALWPVGIVFEWLGDWQLARFKADPTNRGKVMGRGLWRYTRHPNYFGDACVWWGIWLVAAGVDPGAALWTLPGPLFLTFTLVRWSGAALTERGMAERYGEAFADYVRRTPAFVPWFPNPRG